ncbi:alpha-protein kinase vwkA-like [Stylophora pistillata]|uniref:alpha-protein kinase vwkA-like n=1 Tax=Stylophora pistillata TaxID=50429 RepID=UPI000C03B860|nr:alpha-protein kinase vwkA-like [Stylophora pistillata]
MGTNVLKKYKQSEITGIVQLFGSIESHTRKSVQLNALARNFSQTLANEVSVFEFGQTFSYNKVYFRSINNEHVTLESHLEGTFQKSINNDGVICVITQDELSQKAEAYVHYTYVKSKQQLMVADIQGVGYSLCDPEIASAELQDPDDNSIIFCTGNLSYHAIENFPN